MLCKVKGSNKYYARFSIRGKRICRSTGTENKALAEEYEQHLREKLWKAEKLGQTRRTWEEAVVAFCLGKNTEPLKWHLTILDKYCKGRFLDELEDVRDQLVKDRLSQGIKLKNGVSNHTVNKTLAHYRAILINARRKGWIDKVYVEMLPQAPGRVRWLTHEEAECLINELPEHLKAPVRFSLATGLREANVTHLEWSSIDLGRRVAWVQADHHKNKEPHQIPLNSQAMVVLRNQEGKHKDRVFTYRRKPIGHINNYAWRKALKRAGISNFRVHDLRHTWASWHAQNGTPIPVLQKLGGWKTLAMVMRYSHLGDSHISEYAESVCRPRLIRNGSRSPEVVSK